MDWTQILTMLGINIGMFAALASLIVWTVNKLDSDIKNLGNDIKSLGTRLDGHAIRIDQLYKMFVDLVKEKK